MHPIMAVLMADAALAIVTTTTLQADLILARSITGDGVGCATSS
jgi:hypothetical protein